MSPREGSSLSDPRPGLRQPILTPATTCTAGTGGSSRTGTGAVGWGTEGGASSLHRPLLWRPGGGRWTSQERFPREVHATERQASSRPCGRTQALHRHTAAAMARAIPTSRLSCWVPVLLSRLPLPPRAQPACSLSRFLVAVSGGGCAAGALGCCLQLSTRRPSLLSTRPELPPGRAVRTHGRLWCRPLGARLDALLEGGRGRGSLPRDAAAGGNLRTRRSLWAQMCGEARIPRGTRTRTPRSTPPPPS